MGSKKWRRRRSSQHSGEETGQAPQEDSEDSQGNCGKDSVKWRRKSSQDSGEDAAQAPQEDSQDSQENSGKDSVKWMRRS